MKTRSLNLAVPAHQAPLARMQWLPTVQSWPTCECGHEIVVAADASYAVALDVRAAMDGDVLAKRVEVADLGSARLALVAKMLRIGADDRAGANAVALPNRQRPDEVNVRADLTARPRWSTGPSITAKARR